MLEIGRKDEQYLLINGQFGRILLTGSAIKMSGFISMCFLAFCRNKRERDREGFSKEREREWEIDWTKIFKNRD